MLDSGVGGGDRYDDQHRQCDRIGKRDVKFLRTVRTWGDHRSDTGETRAIVRARPVRSFREYVVFKKT